MRLEAWFNDSHVIHNELNLDRPPDHTTLSRWERNVQMHELRRLLRRNAEQAGWSGKAAIDASGFQRDQTSKKADDVVQPLVSRLWPTEATVVNGRDATGEISEDWKFEYDRERRGRAAVSDAVPAHGCREDDQSRDSKSKANEQTTDAQLWQSPLPKPSVRPLVIG